MRYDDFCICYWGKYFGSLVSSINVIKRNKRGYINAKKRGVNDCRI